MTHITCRLTSKNRDQLRTLRSVIEYGLPLPFYTAYTHSQDSEEVDEVVCPVSDNSRRIAVVTQVFIVLNSRSSMSLVRAASWSSQSATTESFVSENVQTDVEKF